MDASHDNREADEGSVFEANRGLEAMAAAAEDAAAAASEVDVGGRRLDVKGAENTCKGAADGKKEEAGAGLSSDEEDSLPLRRSSTARCSSPSALANACRTGLKPSISKFGRSIRRSLAVS